MIEKMKIKEHFRLYISIMRLKDQLKGAQK